MIHYNHQLRPYNTFHISTTAAAFATFDSVDQLQELMLYQKQHPFEENPLVLGGGSNMLFTKPYNGWILKNELKGISVLGETDEFVFVECGGGELWHDFVLHSIANNWAGAENLSLIPGCAGASPIQNIGAYGAEIKDVFHELQAFHLYDNTAVKFSLEECKFGYRESVFKTKFKSQFAITSVTFRMRKQPVFNTKYGAIEQQLEKMGVTQLSIKAVSDAIISIRSSKLPDPQQVGNAGSFFKNPVVNNSQFEALKLNHPGMPHFTDHAGIKIPAAWLIEQCGWKGYRKGDAGVHPHQPLVLVNYGNASGAEIYDLSEAIVQDVQSRFGITLHREVNIY